MDQGESRCPFAKFYQNAHADAGLKRVSLTSLVRKLIRFPQALRRDGLFSLSWLGYDDSGMSRENADRVAGNVLISYLLSDYMGELKQVLDQSRADGSGLYGLNIRPSGPLAPAAQESLFEAMRTASCDDFNLLVTQWAEKRRAEYLVSMKWEEEPTPQSLVAQQAARFFGETELYRSADHNFVSLLHSGNCTALHMCWALVEAAAYEARFTSVDEYCDLVRRSRKSLLPLAAGSLGMVVTYLEESGLHPHDGRAVHPTHHGQRAFVLQDGLLQLREEFIKPFVHGDNVYYTGCPAFYVTGLIETYLESVLDLAVHYRAFEAA